MDVISINPGFMHIFHKIIAFTGYSVFTSDGHLVNTCRMSRSFTISDWLFHYKSFKLVCKQWKILIEKYEMCRLTELSPSINETSFPDFLTNASLKLCRQDMVEYLHQNFPHFWKSFSNEFIAEISNEIVSCNNVKYLTVFRKMMNILTFFMNIDKELKFLSFDKNPVRIALDSLVARHFKIELINLYAERLEMVNYPHQITSQTLVAINEYAAIRGCFKILNIIARKLGNLYVNVAKEILKTRSDFINSDVVKFMKARINGDPIEKIEDPMEKMDEEAFAMSDEFMNQNVYEHDRDNDTEAKSEPNSDNYFLENSDEENEILYESDSDSAEI